ncbi:hypothetical protein QL285_052509 [Trifolium repens]|nr:hypothetical protein QL285_052509 [Trifolium repens]
MLQVHGSIHHEGKNSTRGVEKAVSNSAQYREWLSYLVSGMSRAVTCNTVDNPKEECKALKDMNTGHIYDGKELKEFKEWFETLGMTLEEVYDEYLCELEEYRIKPETKL